MIEIGEVKETKGNIATVIVNKKDECSKCGLCAFPKNASSIEIRCYNEVDAKKGDLVEIEKKESGKLLGALLVFLVPLLLIGVAVLIGLLAIGNELFIPLIAVGLIVIWFVVLGLIDKKLKTLKSFTSKILSIKTKAE